MMKALLTVTTSVNGRAYKRVVQPRLLLSDFLRHELGATGTHVGCEHGVCGACTVRVDGKAVRACLMLAVQADGAGIETIEGLGEADGSFGALQQAFHENFALQCGFCTPGFVMSSVMLASSEPNLSRAQVEHGLAGNLCRCTGYHNIVRAIEYAGAKMRGEEPAPAEWEDA